MPLPAVERREGATPIFPATEAAKRLFDPLGGAIALKDETAFDAISASSATIAAHFAYLDAIARWLVGNNVPEAAARRHVAASFAGLVETLRGPAPNFEVLGRDHATPGGINEQFRDALEEAGLLEAVTAGLDGVFARLVGQQTD